MSYNGKVFVLNFDILGFLQSTIAQGNPIFSGWVDHIFTYAYIHTFLYREVIVKYSEGLPLAKEKWMDASPWLSIWMKIHKEMLFTDFRSSEILASLIVPDLFYSLIISSYLTKLISELSLILRRFNQLVW